MFICPPMPSCFACSCSWNPAAHHPQLEPTRSTRAAPPCRKRRTAPARPGCRWLAHVLEGKVIGDACSAIDLQEFIRFLNGIEAQVPGRKVVSVILDNHAAAQHRRCVDGSTTSTFTFQFTPTSCSWLNAVEGSSPNSPSGQRKSERRLSLSRRSPGRYQPLRRETNNDPIPFTWKPHTQTKSLPPSGEDTKCRIPSTSAPLNGPWLALSSQGENSTKRRDAGWYPLGQTIGPEGGAYLNAVRVTCLLWLVALVIMGHGASPAALHQQAGLGAIKRLDLAFLVDRENHGVG